MERLYQQGVENGVQNQEIITGEEARNLEPNLSEEVKWVLLENDSAIVSPWELALALAEKLNNAKVIHVTTQRGTDIYFYKKDRPAKFFNGNIKDCGGYSSASVEVYVPVEETRTHGCLMLDGSLGYIGKVTAPVQIMFSSGKIIDIEDSPDGNRLKEFIADYNDDKMYTASEFGIGLNDLSRCDGNCYIEDESALGTFHIGLGRNLALGGIWQASGHFDLTSHRPDIYADGFKIMHNGQIIV